MRTVRISTVVFVAAAWLAQPSLRAYAETPAPAATEEADALLATTRKFNAYVEYMNRTLRVSQSLDRYRSWVDMAAGPTGRERYVYGAYEVYDTRSEKAAAEAAIAAAPHLPDLDDAMRAYIAANDAVAPVLNKTAGYYERSDYKIDRMQRGRELHKDIVALGGAFLAARARLESVMTKQKLALDQIRLATIEKHEGRNARWHAGDVMMRAKQALDALQPGRGKAVDMPAFDAAMKDLGTAVAGLDDYKAEHPSAFSGFGSFPDGFLGRLRDIEGRLQRTHGDLRRAAGFDMTFVMSDYNTMVTLSSLPGQFKD